MAATIKNIRSSLRRRKARPLPAQTKPVKKPPNFALARKLLNFDPLDKSSKKPPS
jgi:hypothetical protein